MTEKTIVLPPSPNGNSSDANYRLTVMAPKRRYLSYLRNRWWVVMICLALTVGGVVTYETVRQETYTSYAELYLTLGPQLGISIFSEPKDDFATQIELLKGSKLRRDAIESVGAEAISRLKGPIKVDVVRPMATSILLLQATSSDPNVSQKFLEALIARYLDFKQQTRLSTSEELLKSLNHELSKADEALKTNKVKWAEFQKTNNLTLTQEEAKRLSFSLADLKTQLAKSMFDRQLREHGLAPLPALDSTSAPASILESNLAVSATNLAADATNPVAGAINLMTETTNLAASGSNLPPASIDGALKEAKVELDVRRAERDSEVTNHGNSAKAKALDAEVFRLEHTVAALESEDAVQREKDLRQLNETIALLQTKIPAVETNLQDAGDRLAQAQLISDDIQRQQGYYDGLLKMFNSVDLNKNMAQEGVTEYEEPSVGMPAPRSLPLRIFLAAGVGLFLGLGLVFLWHLFDDRLVSIHDLKDQFGETVLGLVPKVRVPKSKPLAALLEPDDDRAGYVESYRHLRSALLLSSLGNGRPQTLLVTGAIPAEGKTTIAVNLARTLAQGGQRVALVDADLRGGHIHEIIGREAAPGLLDFLRGRAEAGAVIYPTEISGLAFVPSGAGAGETDGLFNRPGLGELMKALKKEHDFIILDSAPILAADDASLLVPHADAVVMVMCPFYTRARQARQALEMLYQRQTRQVALILNRARVDDLASQYYAYKGPSRVTRNGKG